LKIAMFYRRFWQACGSTLAAGLAAHLLLAGRSYQQSGKKLLKVRASCVGRGK
jgi:hypothetical protein